MASLPISEGTIPFALGDDTFHTYYKVVGTLEGRTKRPLVILHGGPGFCHDYMINLSDVATHERPVIFYDQVGSGRSGCYPDKPKEFWTIDLFIRDLFNLLAHFKIEDDFDLLGHSWGTILLFEVIFRRQPAGLKHAILSNPICHMRYYGEARMKQIGAMPESVQEVLKKGYHDTPECRGALAALAKLHQNRSEVTPPEQTMALDYGFKNLHVMASMWAPLIPFWLCDAECSSGARWANTAALIAWTKSRFRCCSSTANTTWSKTGRSLRSSSKCRVSSG
jgi:proline-specific peptidase